MENKTQVYISPNVTTISEPKNLGIEARIAGLKVKLPLKPYPSQMALLSKMITAMKEAKNCLLESPTGSGKTLALLCGALAWQNHERNRIAQSHTQDVLSQHPELNSVNGAADYIASPQKNTTPVKLFEKPVFGEKSIYDVPGLDCGDNASLKRPETMSDSEVIEDSPYKNEVTIHKRRRHGELGECSKNDSPTYTPTRTPTKTPMTTPEKTCEQETPPHLSLPIIYYGARTHKQLQQVIKEFGRTAYCGDAKMTVLASRDYSCIREFDKQMWGTKNDMCRGCTKKIAPKDKTKPRSTEETNCVFYDNRLAMDHNKLPPAFDLEDLVSVGQEIKACPFYGARQMMQNANIVFCPYNYLIEPSIRSSMDIDLQNNIVIIDEAHNIEDICRNAATFTFQRNQFVDCIKELEQVTAYRYTNATKDVLPYLDHLLQTLQIWDRWFEHQKPLLDNKPVNNNEAQQVWEIDHFILTLNNHNIGEHQYMAFNHSVDVFSQHFRDQPDKLYGVTQTTATLLENLNTVYGYLFQNSGLYKDDFKAVLIRNLYGNWETSKATNWRRSQFDKGIGRETLSLRLMCMNPAVIFEGLKTARCIMLASGTLTPLHSMHSELATEFPLQTSPNHVISADRVWIGTLTTGRNGTPLLCNSRGTEQSSLQDAIGEAIQWVCEVTPHGVLCFLPSYVLMQKLCKRWQDTGVWNKLNELKNVFMESRNARDHNEVMEDYYETVSSNKGALLFAVYRGKVSEGMDFKDHQARAVITVGIPYPNMFDPAVKEKMNYNDKFEKVKKLLRSQEWLRVQAYRALNQAVGRCVRHCGDWGAVLLIDSRFREPFYTEHLSKWVKNFLGNNHHTFDSLVNNPNSLESFMQTMTIRENEGEV
ncbi:Fanconi anemia group J protein-like isoform X2 [Hyposmocoma kahamanoa]|uniref:Fanconi anemia group J protein-like isoform X2 n=1 Tax=Hyposmocoma kahamanoa TaxID=1477025 RepID=UPI000E6D5B5E|nr:Fanconi anemia group J protein-like isoform X2 [Hyposmocoma kahamanoa]